VDGTRYKGPVGSLIDDVRTFGVAVRARAGRRGESLRGSGLAYLLSEAAAVTSSAELRLAVATASRNAARAVDPMYDAAGGTALYMSSPLQRYRRDVHAATQHAMVGPDIRETIGAVLLGEDVNTARL
jgi:indole-3-acetate monooxygenase